MPGLYVPHLKDLIVRPALLLMGPSYSSEAAVNLVTGTAIAESSGVYLKQFAYSEIFSGPALGLWQMEPITLHDIFNRWLKLSSQAGVSARLTDALPMAADVETQIIFDLRFGAMMARCKYAMETEPLPNVDDAEGMAQYHKTYYNTRSGSANPVRNVPSFMAAISA